MPARVPTDSSAMDDSAYLSSSLSSLSRSRSSNNLIVRTYKQATQLYLTRRFREAWDVLQTIISAGVDEQGQELEDGVAPVAQSSRGTRTKVWVFYLSLIHAVVELGPEDGGKEFGDADVWRGIARKAREGIAWEEIVGRGYAGQEGEVDAEVVVNLATLLLGHMPDQRVNQGRLESYLASSDDAGGVVGYDGVSTPMSAHSASPKALQARVKVLELYTLHVLPELGEWDYAREFVEGCGNLDEERKEAFLAALEGLKEEREGLKQREVELQQQRERELLEATKRREEEEKRRVQEAEERERQQKQQREQQKATVAKPASTSTANGDSRANAVSNNTNNNNANGHARNNQPSRSARKQPASSPQQPPANNAATLLTRLSTLAHHLRHKVAPSLLSTRLLMFLLAFVLLAARRDMRVKLRRALADGWGKIRRTVGMGVKVSYV